MLLSKQQLKWVGWGSALALLLGLFGMIAAGPLWLLFVFIFVAALFAVACLAFVGYLIGFPHTSARD